jgi:hypothetical protein
MRKQVDIEHMESVGPMNSTAKYDAAFYLHIQQTDELTPREHRKLIAKKHKIVRSTTKWARSISTRLKNLVR